MNLNKLRRHRFKRSMLAAGEVCNAHYVFWPTRGLKEKTLDIFEEDLNFSIHDTPPSGLRFLDMLIMKDNFLIYTDRESVMVHEQVSRSSGPAKTILRDTVRGGRRPGRQRKRWEDNIREWTGLEFAKSHRAVENGGKWRKLVVKSSVVRQRPLRLRDRWRWRWRWQKGRRDIFRCVT